MWFMKRGVCFHSAANSSIICLFIHFLSISGKGNYERYSINHILMGFILFFFWGEGVAPRHCDIVIHVCSTVTWMDVTFLWYYVGSIFFQSCEYAGDDSWSCNSCFCMTRAATSSWKRPVHSTVGKRVFSSCELCKWRMKHIVLAFKWYLKWQLP